MRPIHRARRAFTLIEILVVLAILGLLSALLFSAFSGAREKGHQTTCASNLKQLGIAISLYSDDNSHLLPPSKNLKPQNVVIFWPELLNSYTKNYQIYHCPSDAVQRKFYPADNSYGYNIHIGTDLSMFALNPQHDEFAPVSDSQIVRPSATVVMTDSGTNAIIGLPASQWPVLEPPPLQIGYIAQIGRPQPAPYGRHQGRATILWADGHVSALPLEAFYNTDGHKRRQDRLIGISPCFRADMGCD